MERQEKTCWKCGAEFLCDAHDKVARCWCDELPSIAPSDGRDCLCARCLNEIAREPSERHALANEFNPRGVDIQTFIAAVKSARFTPAQLDTWHGRIADTFDAQRQMLFGSLHGIYCDLSSGEEARVNALSICQAFVTMM